MIARAAVAVTAVLMLAWLGVMERNTRLEARGAAVLRSDADPAALARAERDLRRATRLNPGTAPDVSRALILQAQGRTEASVALLDDVLRREPDNLLAWRVLGVLSPDASRRSFAEQRRLDPLNTRDR